jgi:hypothetical protein
MLLILQLKRTSDRTAADVLASLRERLIDASHAVTRKDWETQERDGLLP